MSLAGCQTNLINVNFHLQKSFWKKISWQNLIQKGQGWKVPSLMPIWVSFFHNRFIALEETKICKWIKNTKICKWINNLSRQSMIHELISPDGLFDLSLGQIFYFCSWVLNGPEGQFNPKNHKFVLQFR